MNYLANIEQKALRAAILQSFKTPMGGLKYESEYFPLVLRVAGTVLDATMASKAAQEWNQHQVSYKSVPSGAGAEQEDNYKLLSAIWGLVGEGVLYPRLKETHPDGYPTRIDRVVLTERGRRVIDGGDEHPLHPGFMNRFKSRAPNMSDEVIARMEDAISCLEGGVPRAAMVMLGLAAEETLRVTHAAMVKLAYIGKPATALTNAKDVLRDIEVASHSWNNSDDEKHRLTFALATAESIRVERNRASHPGATFDELPALEELAIIAARQLPIFWQIPVKQAVEQNGFVVP